MKTVYFIKPIGMDGPIKIGCSIAPERRRSTLATWSPFALEIVAQIEGDHEAEWRFHAMFEHLHERREWFRAGPDLLACIDQISRGEFDVACLPEAKRLDNRRTGRGAGCGYRSAKPAAVHTDLIAEIEAHCSSLGIGTTTFGRDAIGDPQLLRDLRAGRELRAATVAKIRAAMVPASPVRIAA